MEAFQPKLNKELLHEYIKGTFGYNIPRVAVCPNHCAPYDFVYDVFTGKNKTALAMANRSGGKTLDFAILDLLFAKAHDGCEISTLGAIQPQAQRCYNYVKDMAQRSEEYAKFTKNLLMKRSDFINESVIEILTATLNGVNSPHPQKSTLDEVELIPWFILQQAFNMTQSKGDIRGQTILGSTRKFATGSMQRLINEAESKGWIKLYSWCVWEVMQPPVQPFARLQALYGADLPGNIINTDGYYSWDDLQDHFIKLDREVWEAEWLCKRPGTEGLVYPKFSDELNGLDGFILDRSKQFYIWEDYGYALTHPDVVLLVQVDYEKPEVIVFDELYLTLMNTSQIVENVIAKLREHGLEVSNLSGWIGDPHGLTETRDRYNLGLPILEKVTEVEIPNAAQLYLIKNRIPLVRKFIDNGWLKFTPNCVNYRDEMMGYARVRKSDGTYTDEPKKIADHGPDATGYGMVRLFPSIGMASFSVIPTLPESQQQPIRPITADWLTKKL